MRGKSRLPMTWFCPAEKLRDADRPGGWCQLGHVGANRRPIGTASSSTMPMASPASLAAPPIARHCTPDDYSDDCRESTIRVCAEVDTWASVDRSGPLRAGSYHLPTVCNAAIIGSSHKRRWSDLRHQLTYRGAASVLPMAWRGEAQRPIRVRYGFTWTGPVGYYPRVTSPGRVASCGARLEA